MLASAAANAAELLKLYIESGADEAYGAFPHDYFAAAGVKKILTEEARARESVSMAEAKARAAVLAAEAPDNAALCSALESFSLCPLKKFSSSTICGYGAAAPKLLVITEIPNAIEDRNGRFPDGETGELLKRILAAINMSLEADAYAFPFMPYRPAGGRAPTAEEADTMAPFAERHIELLHPKAMLFMGALPAAALLGLCEPITAIRGKWREYKGIPAMATFPPQFLIANREAKKLAWEDVQEVEKLLNAG